MDKIQTQIASWSEKIITWLQSPSFLAQLLAIIMAVFLAQAIATLLKRKLGFFSKQPKGGRFLALRVIAFRLRDLLFAAVLIALLVGVSFVLTTIEELGQDWLVRIAQGLAVIFLLYKAVRRFISHPLVQRLVLWIGIPLAILKVFGWLEVFISTLDEAVFVLGDIKFSALMFANLLVFGSLLFWIGRISNTKGKAAIRASASLDAGTREVFAKIFELALFGILFVLLLNIVGINLSALVVLGGAIGLGIGFGLQQIAANFISGMILLLDRSLKIGDFVELPDGQQGYVTTLNMRSATIETTDGKDIMVPNVKFIEEAYKNWTHRDTRQRYEVSFAVSYDTDIDTLESILIPAISAHKQVLQDPEQPDLELRNFGDFGINFAVEFWADGIDDGVNKFTSDLNFIVWRTLRQHGITMPLPQQEIRILK